MIKNFRNEPFGAWVTPEISAVSVWVSVDLPKGLLKFELHWTDGEFGTGRGPWFRSPQSPPNCRLAEWFNPPQKITQPIQSEATLIFKQHLGAEPTDTQI